MCVCVSVCVCVCACVAPLLGGGKCLRLALRDFKAKVVEWISGSEVERPKEKKSECSFFLSPPFPRPFSLSTAPKSEEGKKRNKITEQKEESGYGLK